MVNSQLRIAMLSIHSCPIGTLGTRDTGGMSVYIRELSRELGKRGFHVDIFTRAHDSADQEVTLSQNVRLIHLNASENSGIHKLVLYPYLPDFACDLENFRKRDGVRYDLIFSHYWLSGLMGKILQLWWHVPHLIMFHTLGAVKNAIGVGEEEPELRIEAERDLAQTCDYIIAATAREKYELIEHYGASPQRIGVVPCGVNLKLFHPMDKKTAREKLKLIGDNILFVGRIEPLKGIERLLRAMPLLGHRKPRLIVIGGGEQSSQEMERLKRLSGELKIEHLVNFLGVLEHEQLPYYYNAADVCVLPSYQESFGLTALEALACGTPVVATDVGGLQEIIRQGKAGYIVTDASPENLAEKIGAVLHRNSLMNPSGIRNSVARYDWSHIADMIMKEFRTVLSVRPGTF